MIEELRIIPGKKVKLSTWDPEGTGNYPDDNTGSKQAKRDLKDRVKEIQKMQARLFASGDQALLVVLQAMDTAGKDSTIRRVFSPINPQGCRVHAFKKPTPLELSHHFLWRITQKNPPRGYMAIFNRSHYEDVLITRVHGMVSDELAEKRFEEIRNFEKSLIESGTKVLKFYLHISKEEQAKRLQDRLDDPEKHWKFNPGDLEERKLWDDYQKYYEAALHETSTDEAPWYVVPAGKKWFRDIVVAEAVHQALSSMNLEFPEPEPGVDYSKIKIL